MAYLFKHGNRIESALLKKEEQLEKKTDQLTDALIRLAVSDADNTAQGFRIEELLLQLREAKKINRELTTKIDDLEIYIKVHIEETD